MVGSLDQPWEVQGKRTSMESSWQRWDLDTIISFYE